MSKKGSWIVFSYRLASETSTLRVRAWRILKRIGALSLQHSVCVVPGRPVAVRKLKQLQKLFEESGGEVIWLEVCSLVADSEALLTQRFIQAVSKEYQEFITECAFFEPDNDAVHCELEMKRLERVFNKIRSRDYFGCPLALLADKQLSAARVRYASWLNMVNEKNDVNGV